MNSESHDQSTGSNWASLTTWRSALIVLLCALATAAAAFAVSSFQETRYSASAALVFRDPGFDERFFGSSTAGFVDPERKAATNLELVGLDVVAEETAAALPFELSTDEIQDRIKISAEGISDVVKVEATSDDAQSAATLANAFANAYVETRRAADRQRVADARDELLAEYEALPPEEQSGEPGAELLRQMSQLRTLRALQTGDAEVVTTAEVPESPSAPRTTRNVIVGFLFGGLIGLGAAYAFARIDQRLRTLGDIEGAFGLPVLSRVPEDETFSDDRRQIQEVVQSPAMEAFRMLRARLRYFNIDRPLTVVAVTSCAPGEGKSTAALHLALAANAAGARAILVEADFHQPVLALRRGFAPLPGLSEVLTNQASLDSSIQTWREPANGEAKDEQGVELELLAAGVAPPNPVELLESDEMKSQMERLAADFDLVVLDCPPALAVADAIPLLGLAEGVLVVAQVGQTRADAAHQLRSQLDRLGCLSLGVVANKDRPNQKYGYGYVATQTMRTDHGPQSNDQG